MKRIINFLILIFMLIVFVVYLFNKNDTSSQNLKIPIKKDFTKEINKCLNEYYEYEYDFSDAIDLDGEYSFHYKDLTLDDVIFSKDSETRYYAASILKLPYALFLYDKLQGEDLDEVLTYEPKHNAGGAGIIRHGNKENLSVGYLLHHSIEDSDNIAYKMLVDKFGQDEAGEYWENLGAEHSFKGPDIFGNTSIEDSVIFLDYLYGLKGNKIFNPLFVSSNKAKKRSVINGLKNKDVNFKYGLSDLVYHEIFIVNEKHPYTVGILSYRSSVDYTEQFNKIYDVIEKNHNGYWSEKEEFCNNKFK